MLSPPDGMAVSEDNYASLTSRTRYTTLSAIGVIGDNGDAWSKWSIQQNRRKINKR